MNENESGYIGKVLMIMAECTSSGLTKFSGWLLVGFAVILGALLSNLEATQKFLVPDTLGTIAVLFSSVVSLNLLQRYSAAVVSASIETGKKVSEFPPPQGIDINNFMKQLEEATLWPARIFLRRSNAKVLAGDLAAAGRLISLFAQVEAWLVFAQLLIAIAATLVLARGLCG